MATFNLDRLIGAGKVGWALVVISVFISLPATAKIGAPTASFDAKMGKLFLLKDHNLKEGVAYYHYVLIGDPDRQRRSPGFGAGMTLTVKANKITGQSLVIRLGQNRQVGKMFSVMLSMNVCYEALGKDPPKTEKVTNQEVKSYASAIERALSGAPQSIRYNGYPMKITISRTKESDLLVAITSNAPITGN
jgi:hypothetical protein